MATQTTNLHLIKPDYSDDADVAVLNGNMEILDTKIGGTSMGTTATSLTGAIAEVNSATVHTSDVVNNLTSTSATAPLSANQGRTLKDTLDALKTFDYAHTTIIQENTDLDNLTTPGVYSCQTGSVAASLSNCPTTDSFTLIVAAKSSETLSQMIIGTSVHFRWKASTGFSIWHLLAGGGTLAYEEETATATHSIKQGEYLYFRDGVLYKAKSDIPVGTTLSSSNIQSVPNGGLNEIVKYALIGEGGTTVPNNANFNSYTTPGTYRVLTTDTAGTLVNCPNGFAGTLYVKNSMNSDSANYKEQMYISIYGTIFWRTTINGGTTWTPWRFLNGMISVSCGTISSLPVTVNNAKIFSNHVVVKAQLGTPSAQTGNWTVTTSDGSLTISGTITGSTTCVLFLQEYSAE